MKAFFINLAFNWIIGALRSEEDGVKGKIIDGLKKIPDSDLRLGLTDK